MRTSSAAGLSFIEEACICMGTKYHVACSIDNAIIQIGSNIVKDEVHQATVAAWQALMTLRATSGLLLTALV